MGDLALSTKDKAYSSRLLFEGVFDRAPLHSMSGPALVEHYPDGQVRREAWFVNGVCWREGGPAEVTYHPSGVVESETWRNRKGRIDRKHGPAFTSYYPNASKRCEAYLRHGILHRPMSQPGRDYPALTWWEPPREGWTYPVWLLDAYFLRGRLHREDGQAVESVWFGGAHFWHGKKVDVDGFTARGGVMEKPRLREYSPDQLDSTIARLVSGLESRGGLTAREEWLLSQLEGWRWPTPPTLKTK